MQVSKPSYKSEDKWFKKITLLIGNNSEFEEDISILRKNSGLIDLDSNLNIMSLLKKYDLPSSVMPFIDHYINTGEIEGHKIRPPVIVVSDREKTFEPSDSPHQRWHLINHYSPNFEEDYVKLLVSKDATKAEVAEFIENEWSIILRRQEGILEKPKPRIKGSPRLKLCIKLLAMHDKGQTNQQILEFTNKDPEFRRYYPYLNLTQVRSMISYAKKHRNSKRRI